MLQTLNNFHKEVVRTLPHPRLTWAYDRESKLVLVQSSAKQLGKRGVFRVATLIDDGCGLSYGEVLFQVTAVKPHDAIALANGRMQQAEYEALVDITGEAS